MPKHFQPLLNFGLLLAGRLCSTKACDSSFGELCEAYMSHYNEEVSQKRNQFQSCFKEAQRSLGLQPKKA